MSQTQKVQPKLHNLIQYNYCYCQFLPFLCPHVKAMGFADGIDQDQTAKNVQSDHGCMVFTCLIKNFWSKFV